VIEKCDEIDRIDVTTNVHMKVSCVRLFGVTIENHIKCTDVIENEQI
jgi:hypothetical protein